MKLFNFKCIHNEARAQNVVELTVLIAASMIALMMIFMIYSNQFGVLMSFNDYHTARASVRKVVDAANTVYYAGPGSEIRILVEMPPSVLIDESGITGKTVHLKMDDGSDILDVADVNINGQWQENSKYYMVLRYDGNVVWQVERGFEIIGGTFFVIRGGPSTFDRNFMITNTLDKALHFSLDLYFPEQGGMKVTLRDGENPLYIHQEFNLLSGESKVVNLRIVLLGWAESQLNTGIVRVEVTGEDYSWVENLFTSVEFVRG